MTITTDDGGDLTPQEWLDPTVEKGGYDRPWTHLAPEFPAVRAIPATPAGRA
jgi:hypothetical protein